MPDIIYSVGSAIDEADRTYKMLGKKTSAQVTATEERALLKAVCLTWLRTLRPELAPYCDGTDLGPIDSIYQELLEATEGRPLRKTLRARAKEAKSLLISLRTKITLIDTTVVNHSDQPPQLAKLAPDPDLHAILLNRWNEVLLCMNGGANLAAIVMMGGLLEALLLARIERETDKSAIFKATAAPKKDGTTLKLQEWGLKDYIDVAHELGWLTKSAKDVGDVLRDWRNYVHPHKEHRHKVVLSQSNTLVLWGVTTSIATQVVASAK